MRKKLALVVLALAALAAASTLPPASAADPTVCPPHSHFIYCPPHSFCCPDFAFCVCGPS